MNTEIEARFLDINKQELIDRLVELEATDKGEVTLSEVIFYDQANTWSGEGRFVRVRSSGGTTKMTYKHHHTQAIDGAHEIEFAVPNTKIAEEFLEAIGLVAFRHQEKKRHTFEKDGVTVDIDTWPQVPTYVELEGPSEDAIRSVAQLMGLKWEDAVFEDARAIIQGRYNIPVGDLKWFTFERVE